MVNVWTDKKLKRDLLEKIKISGGYVIVFHPIWKYAMILKSKKGDVLFDATDTVNRAWIINDVIRAYDSGHIL